MNYPLGVGIAVVCLLNLASTSTENPGKCPPQPAANLPPEVCKVSGNECSGDAECSDGMKCCTDGCNNVCTTPIFTGCEQIREIFGRQARHYGEDKVFVPRCSADGEFEKIQCNNKTGVCWCVNDLGHELAGTRAPSYELVNCSAPRDCAGFLCRMLCPYGFDLDDEGCPVCQCRNPCDNFHCPDDQECQIEELPCGKEVCPPLPTCKRARSLDDLCPVGSPLSSPKTGHPILCGVEPNKPQCPHSYLCEVQPGNDYGVCCSLIEKPGQCPSHVDVVPGECPEENCTMDMDCEGVEKCCDLPGCGKKACLKPGNTTLCLQQKAVVELLLGYKPDYKGYIPQCTEEGAFVPRQCSLNGKLCWCVDVNGTEIRGTMAPAESVICDQGSPSTAAAPSAIPKIDTSTGSPAPVCKDKDNCDLSCKSGYKYDSQGCMMCECNDPCEAIQCPEGSECLLMKVDPCFSDTCLPIPTCHRKASKVCSFGNPLMSNDTGKMVQCNADDCPSPYFCEILTGETTGVCCPQATDQTSSTAAPSQVTMSCPEYIPENIACDNVTCQNDDDCKDGQLCCISQTCGPICVAHKLPRLPTICEYLREMSFQLARQSEPQQLAIPVPQCNPDGSYSPRQCDQSDCWCVDDFGTEINNSRVPAYQHVDCNQVRGRLNCNGLVCRLGCDYGFEVDDITGCPLCDCRDPCKSAKCPEDHECQVVEGHCKANWCPPIPQCLPTERPSKTKDLEGRDMAGIPKCPIGSPMMFEERNLPVTCDPDSKYQQCPDTHTCLVVSESAHGGVCCPHFDKWDSYEEDAEEDLGEDHPSEEDESKEVNHIRFEKNGTCPKMSETIVSGCVDTCDNDEECSGVQKCCLNGCGAKTCLDPEGYSRERNGQCPYLVPLTSHDCSLQCSKDSDCPHDFKCCSNGCGTVCTKPLLLTACQHQRLVWEHRARELAIPAAHTFLPSCRMETGEFEPMQCDPVSQACWCVDRAGMEIPGTRRHGDAGQSAPNCSLAALPAANDVCPLLDCGLPCEHGYKLDKDGCPMCECRDPCQGVTCPNPSEECRMVQLQCVSEPCPPLPLCLPRVDNPCLSGEPLPDPSTGGPYRCGPGGSQCPTSHKCHLSPLGEYSVCCPKPRDVCFQPMSPGPCDAYTTRWHYNKYSNQCERFTYGGCDGTLNNFETREQCMQTCAVLSSCERTRQHNLKLKKNYNRVVFLPKCNKVTHEWDPVQCLDSVGLCWCVTPQGDQIPGTVVRGLPHCNSRSGRTYTGDDPLCEDGRPAHVCPSDLCEGKICLAYRNATCRINPCGGCTPEFYNEFNRRVNCYEGLSACHTELQTVLNSMALSVHNLDPEEVEQILPPRPSERPPSYSEEEYTPFPPHPPPPPPYPTKENPHFAPKRDQKTETVLPMMIAQEDDLQAVSSHHHISILLIAPRLSPSPGQRQRVPLTRQSRALTLQLPSILQPYIEMSANIIGPREQVTRMEYVSSAVPTRSTHVMPSYPKPGQCPRQYRRRCMPQDQQLQECQSDSHCPADEKCCHTMCGPRCMPPFHPEKPGTCPPLKSRSMHFAPNLLRLLSCATGQQCSHDSQCPGSAKCCPMQCGHVCTRPISYRPKPAYMVVPLPLCSSEGGYAITQRQEDLSWCVNEYGTPYHHTLTRGDVVCDTNGTILSRDHGPVCPEGVRPRVCKSECLTASCFLHPDAICVADPCRNCEVTFVNSHGEKVDCEGSCVEPPRIGPCFGYHYVGEDQYYFNQSSQQCEKLTAPNQCLGSNNHFGSFEDCQARCVAPVPVCEQPKEVGMCRAQIPRWFYNKHTHQCESFYFGGCGGNENNFETQEACEARCPDLVMCPWTTVTGQDMEACSRSVACAGALCSANPDAICTADPCTCTPAFVDKSGNPLNCDTPRTETPPMLVRPSIPEMTRCQSLRQRYLHNVVDDPTVVDYIPQCDERGNFLPMQCPRWPTSNNHALEDERTKIQECWCVNEAGLQLPGTSTFPPANGSLCRFVKVKRVDVTLAFQHTSPAYALEMMPIIKHLVLGLLKDVGAEVTHPDLEASVSDDTTTLQFSLTGDSNVHVAFLLEEMVRSGGTQIQLPEALMAADFRKSHFYHVSDYIPQVLDDQVAVRSNQVDVEEDPNIPSIIANRVHLATPMLERREPILFLAAAFTLAALALLWCCLYNRKKSAKKELKPKPIHLPVFSQQAFTSLLYNLTGKKPKEEELKKEPLQIATIESQFESLQVKDEDFKIPEPPPLYKEEEKSPEKSS